MRLTKPIVLASLAVLLAASAATAVATLAPAAPAVPAPAMATPKPAAAAATDAFGLCVGNVYNNQQGPSSGCDGVVCVGYANGDWQRCVLDCTTCEPVAAADGQAAVCVYGDAYNTGSIPCPALACYGQTQYAWQTCVGRVCLPPRCHIPPPGALDDSAALAADQVALCVYGDAYNTGGSRCAGAVCVGWTMGHWVDCYPRIPPCWACPPPPGRTD